MNHIRYERFEAVAMKAAAVVRATTKCSLEKDGMFQIRNLNRHHERAGMRREGENGWVLAKQLAFGFGTYYSIIRNPQNSIGNY